MPYTIQHIAEVLGAQAVLPNAAQVIDNLLIDSRRLILPGGTLFFALKTQRQNGEAFVAELYKAGVRNFVITPALQTSDYNEANFLIVDDPLRALQALAAYHRSRFSIPVIGITGSNGKTIVKEWLYQLLQADYNIVRSPKSYNSQIGVPLSVWQLNEQHTLAIFEAGISEPSEMDHLEAIIRPNIGVLTNVGAAHSANFSTKQQKVAEKFKLFKNAWVIISNSQDEVINNFLSTWQKQQFFIWGNGDADLRIEQVIKQTTHTDIKANYRGQHLSISIPFTDEASIENALTCWSVLLYLNLPHTEITSRIGKLQPVEMRLQLKNAVNNCVLINDSYSNDLSSLRIALGFLQQQAGNLSATVILSDLGEVASYDEQYFKVLQALVQHRVTKFIGIGPRLQNLQTTFREALPQAFFFSSVNDFVNHFNNLRFRDEVILLKGARSFEFEQIDLLFEQKIHQTVLEVNLSAMVHNLKQYQQKIAPNTRVMAMVKAFSYGSGTAEVASVLQYHKVDYLAVAYADEGVALRKAGIRMPIMVMNPETITFQSLAEYNLEPEMYSFGILKAFDQYLLKAGVQKFAVHIKIDTGMHRLGFEPEDIAALSDILKSSRLMVKTVFSHFVSSESPRFDSFTQSQAESFMAACRQIQQAIGYSFIRHISNSAAIFRHPAYQFDMVRLGIGLYGVDSSAGKHVTLLPVATLRTTIAQIRQVKAGETVGYSRSGVVVTDSTIATIRIGYADGFNRRLGNGVGRVYVKGHLVPVIGNVCMDMTMIDITGINGIAEGDAVEIFGPNLPVQQVADWCQTIPYEIMTGISQRVKRIYYEE